MQQDVYLTEMTAVHPQILMHRSQFWDSNGLVRIYFTSQFKIVSNLKSEVQRVRLLFTYSTKFYGFYFLNISP